ncbi:MAG: hypothetical protein M1308_03065 [Actinobacteria bacterium]|nr:hypothetical protein [Actinomycetota bacterium]MCL5069861.1 hypothetical protein [Actinomycetota bacterium]
MKDIIYYSDDSYLGEGMSLGIARGMLVKYKDMNIVQEGLGIGNLALKNGLMTYFASTGNTIQFSDTQFRKTFFVDSVLLWRINGKVSTFVTRIIDILAQCYMLLPGLQNNLLRTGTSLRNLFKLTPQLIKIAPIAEACFNYSVEKDELYIECKIKSLAGYLSKVFILNELGADYFTNGIRNEEIVSTPTGWNYIKSKHDCPAFYNPEYNLSFLVKKINVNDSIPYKTLWGREKTRDLSWAGFEFELDCRNKKIKSFGCRYIANIK